MKDILLKNGRVIDPKNNIDKVCDILISDGTIVRIENNIALDSADQNEIYDATGLWVCPGFIDMHVHLREPGQTHKEDIESGTLAALFGGFTAVACMPNTTPVIDTPELVKFVVDRARETGHVKVYPISAATKGLDSTEFTDVIAMMNAGAVAFSNDGKYVPNISDMKKYSAGYLIIEHCEDPELSAGGVLHDCKTTDLLGYKGISRESEYSIVKRDIDFLRQNPRSDHIPFIHFTHISTAGSIALIRAAKAEGLPVTCDVTPHHLLLTTSHVNNNTNRKMNPPLRSKEDVDALRTGLVDGTIDAIATDHAPHTDEEKAKGMVGAPFGTIGLETAIPVMMEFYHTGMLSASEIVNLMSRRPAEILKVTGGSLSIGSTADVTIINPEKMVFIEKEMFHSKSKNSAFFAGDHSPPLYGRAVSVIIDGEFRFKRGEYIKKDGNAK